MKQFNYVGPASEIVELTATQVEGRRFYKTPDDKWYPSVTTVTSHISAPTIKAWEERVGWEKAEKIRRTSSLRGSKYHGIVESYLKGDLQKVEKSEGLPAYLFGFARKDLDRIDNIHCIEAPLYSNDLCLAGRVDCIAEFDGELAIIDFKYWERTGCEVKKLVTLSIAEDGQTQVVQKYDKIPYIDTLCEWIKEFRYFLGSKV